VGHAYNFEERIIFFTLKEVVLNFLIFFLKKLAI